MKRMAPATILFTLVSVSGVAQGIPPSPTRGYGPTVIVVDPGALVGSRDTCRQMHIFDASKSAVWDAFMDAWGDLGLPSLPDQPGDVADEDSGRIHATLHPAVSGTSWGPETSCCDTLTVDASVVASGSRTRVDLRLAVGFVGSDCCDLDMPGYEMEQAFFDKIREKLPAPDDSPETGDAP